MFAIITNDLKLIIDKSMKLASKEMGLSLQAFTEKCKGFNRTITTQGKVQCVKCGKIWSSARLVVKVDMKAAETIKCYGQDCRKCHKMGKTTLYEDVTVERFVNRLIFVYGKRERGDRKKRVNTVKAHDSKNCHACKAGDCIGN